MTKRSKETKVADIVPGMVLSDDLQDSQGNVLLPEGTVLTEATLTALGRHEIEMLPILCEELPAADQAAELARREQRLACLFRNAVGDETAGQMMQYLKRYRLGGAP